MTVKRKALEIAAKELNFFLDPNPPINVKEKSDVLKTKVIEAGNLLEDGEQELSLSTETGLSGDDLEERKTKIAGIQNTLKELGVALFMKEGVVEETTEKIQAENKDGRSSLIDMVQTTKKLVDLKAIVEAEDEFEALREKLDGYAGLHGVGLLKIAMLDVLTGTATMSKTRKGDSAIVSILQTSIIHVKVKDNPKKKGTKSFDRFKLYKDGITVQDYCKAGGMRADIKWDVAHGFISATT